MALRSDFQDREHSGKIYTGVGLSNQPRLEDLIGKALGFPVEINLSLYRLGRPQDRTTNWIHADNGCGEYAGILYLNPDNQGVGGTAFWSHLKYGDRVPDYATQAIVDELTADSEDQSKWMMNGLVSMRFNRFISYPTRIFHSRYPKEGWGESIEDSRIIWTCFFSRKEGGA